MADTTTNVSSLYSDAKVKKIDDGIQKLTRYAQAKAAKEEDDVIVDFNIAEQACRLLLAKIIITQRSDPNSVPKNVLTNFLDVISLVESYRIHIAKKSEEALTWHVFYQKENTPLALPPDEATKLEDILKVQPEWRQVYMKIVKKTIALDFYYLFISKPWSASDYVVRLLEYNPHIHKPGLEGNEPYARKCIHFLSEEEKNVIKATSKQSLQFVKDSHAWLEKNYGNDILVGLHSREFQKVHPPPTDPLRLENLVHYYLKHVSDTYNTFTSIIPNQPNQNDYS